MRSLYRIAKHQPVSGAVIPQPLHCVQQLGFEMHRGQLSLWVAAPGGGKTLLALTMALRASIPTLYVSADTDRTDQSYRAARALGWDGVDTDEKLAALAGIESSLRFDFESSPTANDIYAMCEAYALVWGTFPHLVIVDTLAKVWGDGGDEVARNKEGVDRCQEIARETGAHVMVLHHASKGFDSGDRPIPLDGLMSGVSKQPEQVVTMWRDEDNRLTLAVVKNRSGAADPTAQRVRSHARLNFEYMRIEDIVAVQIDWTADAELVGGVHGV